MSKLKLPLLLSVSIATVFPLVALGQGSASTWTFAVSGDSRNCGDFVMPGDCRESEG